MYTLLWHSWCRALTMLLDMYNENKGLFYSIILWFEPIKNLSYPFCEKDKNLKLKNV